MRVLAGDDDVDLAAELAELDRPGPRRVCREGGPHLFGSLVAVAIGKPAELLLFSLADPHATPRAVPLPGTDFRYRA